MKKLLLFLFSLVFLVGCGAENRPLNSTSPERPNYANQAEAHTPKWVSVKYRDSQVDVANPLFEYLDTSKSSLVTGAWYDESNKYMVIGLNSTNYHYCGMPVSAWEALKRANSYGSHYNAYIKGNYDCRINYMPSY